MIEKVEYRIFEFGKYMDGNFGININKKDIYDYYKNNYEYLLPNLIPNNIEIKYQILWVIKYKLPDYDVDLIYDKWVEISTNSVFLKQDIEHHLSLIDRKNYSAITNRQPIEMSKMISFLASYNKTINFK